MNTKGRSKSKNIEDRRSYFGSNNKKGNGISFLQDSFLAARTFKQQPYNSFKKKGK